MAEKKVQLHVTKREVELLRDSLQDRLARLLQKEKVSRHTETAKQAKAEQFEVITLQHVLKQFYIYHWEKKDAS